MTSKNFFIYLFALGLLAQSCAKKEAETAESEPQEKIISIEEYGLEGANILAFGPDNTLFIGDSKGAMIHAVQVKSKTQQDPIPYNLEGIDETLSELLGVEAKEVLVQDMKVHPQSQQAYIAIKLGHDPEAKSVVAVAEPTTGAIEFLKVNEQNSTRSSVQNPASSELVFWKETPASALTITDMDYHDGHLYVAGLTNSEFASTLRKIKFPFNEEQEKVDKIEIYHAVHTQNETRAPIRTMLFEELNGEPVLIASYTCTPLVTIPSEEIKANASITGKTIAELGYGNTPLDMLVVTTQGMDGSQSKSLLVTNKNRGGTMIPLTSVEKGATGRACLGSRRCSPPDWKGFRKSPQRTSCKSTFRTLKCLVF